MSRWARVLLAAAAAAGLTFSSSQSWAARRGLFEWDSVKIIPAKKLPFEFQTTSGKHFDLGYLYKRVIVLFVPVWTYGGRWCLYVPGIDKYLGRYDQAQTLALLRDRGVALPTKPPALPFWDRVGGKLVWGAILMVIVLVILAGRRKRERVISRVDPKTGQVAGPPPGAGPPTD